MTGVLPTTFNRANTIDFPILEEGIHIVTDQTIDVPEVGRSDDQSWRVEAQVPLHKQWLFRLVFAGLGMTSVLPLLAWVYDLGPFHVWFWAVTVPGGAIILAAALWAKLRHRGGEVHLSLIHI